MEIFKYMETYDYEQLVFCQDEQSGLKAIIAIHDTTLGLIRIVHLGRIPIVRNHKSPYI
jgi:hypothetical protein